MSAFEIVLASAIIIAAALQVVVLFFLYRVVARLAERTEKLLSTLEPELDDLAVGIRAIRRAVEFSTTEIQSTLAAVRATTDELTAIATEQGQEIARVVGKASAAAERQVAEVDQALDRAREHVAEIGDQFDRVILEPARNILAVAYGVRRAVGYLIAPRRGREEPHGEGPDVGSP